MLKLVLISPGLPDEEIVVQGDVATIGRVPSCDLVVDQPYVSKQHLRILHGTVIVDLGSSNGTFIEGQRVLEPALLGDRSLTISKNGVRVRVEVERPEEPVAPTVSGEALAEIVELEALRAKNAALEAEAARVRRDLIELRETGDKDQVIGRLQGENDSLKKRLDSLKREVEDREVDDGGSVQARLAMQRVESIQELNERLQAEIDRLKEQRAEAPEEAYVTQEEFDARVADVTNEVRLELQAALEQKADLARELEAIEANAVRHADQTGLIKKLRQELEAARANQSRPDLDVAAALQASQEEVSSLRERIGELEARATEVKPLEGAQVSDMFFKLQSENAELRRKVTALESGASAGAGQAPSQRDPKLVKELMEARLRITSLESELSNLRVASQASLSIPKPPSPAQKGAKAERAQSPAGSDSDTRRVLMKLGDEDIEALGRPVGGPAEEFILVESVRLLRHVERVVTRVAGDLIQLFQLQTILPDTAGSYRSLVLDVLEDGPDGYSRHQLVEYLETLGRWLVASIGAHRKAAALFAERLKADLTAEALTAKDPLPVYARAPVLAGNELWRRTQAYLVALSPDTIDERVEDLARKQAQELLDS